MIDPKIEFANFSTSNGYTLGDDVITDKLRRFRVDGDSKNEKSGWYILHADGVIPCGIVGNWRAGDRHKWIGKPENELTPEERAYWRQKCEEDRKRAAEERDRDRDETARKSEAVWDKAGPLPLMDIPYYRDKLVEPHGARQAPKGSEHPGWSLIDFRDIRGRIVAIQYIKQGEIAGDSHYQTGKKRWPKGSHWPGCFHEVPGDPSGVIEVCEGFATGLSIHEATGQTTLVCADAGNLVAVARQLSDCERFRGRRFRICGDVDASQAGQRAANEAAAALKAAGRECSIVLPVFTPEQVAAYGKTHFDAEGKPKAPSDFNDLHQLAGLDEVRRQIEGASGADTQAAGDTIDEPIPLRRPPKKQEPYPVECLLETAGMVERLAAITHTPLSIVGSEALAAMSLVVQERYDVGTTLFKRTPTSLFFMGIGDSSLGKDQIDSIIMKPKEEFEEKLEAQYQSEQQEYEIALEAYEIDKSRAKKKSKSGADFIEEVKGMDKPQAPRKPYYTLSDFTYEGVYKHLERGRPAMGIFSSEGGSVFSGFAFNDENKSKTVTNFSSIWSGRGIDRGRVLDGVGKLYGRRLCSSTLLQPIYVKKILGDETMSGQGYLNRHLITWPDMQPKVYELVSLDKLPEVKKFHMRMNRWLTAVLPQDTSSGRLILEVMPLTGEAESAYKKFFDELQVECLEGRKYELVQGFARKTAENALRIAGVLTGFHSGAAFGEIPTVTIREMDAGIRLATWYLDEILRIKLNEIASPEILQAEQLLQWFWTRGIETTSVKQVLQFGPNALREKAKIEPLFSILETHGWIAPIVGGAMVRYGKATDYARKAWRVSPKPAEEEIDASWGGAISATIATESQPATIAGVADVAEIAGGRSAKKRGEHIGHDLNDVDTLEDANHDNCPDQLTVKRPSREVA